MSENAFRIASVDPVTVTIRSGQEPSEILILAPLCWQKRLGLELMIAQWAIT